ncbi:MAG: hypothetical protein ACI9KE_006218 [Polyangiales bacterium]|jgi:hypothetical protein
MDKSSPSRLLVPLLASLTLGLAPFVPEPHLVGKIRWVLGGAEGMGPADWGDLAMHGAPWVWFCVTLVSVLRARSAKEAPSQTPS